MSGSPKKRVTGSASAKARRDAAEANSNAEESAEAARSAAKAAIGLVAGDILLRSVGRLSRHAMERAVLGRRYDSETAREAIENRSLLYSLAALGVTRLATRSVPGALLVGGGLAVKALLDRSKARRADGVAPRKSGRKRPGKARKT